MSEVQKTLEWVRSCQAAYKSGDPSPALDQVGSLMAHLALCLDILSEHDKANRDYEVRSQGIR